MANDKILKFQVAIQDNATKGLDEIEKKFLGLSHQAVSVVGTINKELQSIGGISFNMPDLSKMISQLNNLHDVASKKNTGDIPIFKNTLEQMQQLQNFIGKNTLGGELSRIKQSINSLFSEIPNVNAHSFTSYFNQLSKAYNEFVSKMGNSRTMPSGLMDIGGQLQRMGALSGDSSLLRDYQVAAQGIKSTILNTIQEIFSSIQATKSLLSSNALDFGRISGNIDKTTESLNKLAEAFRNFNGTIGGDKSLLNTMAGMGEIIRNVKFSMNQLEEGNKSLHLSKSMQDFAKSINDAQIQMVKLEELHDRLNRTASRGLDKLGVDATNAIRQRQVEMTSIFSNLQQIANNGGVHPVSGLTASQYMGSSDVQIALMRAKREEADVRKKVEETIKQEEQAEKQNGAAKQQSVGITARLTQEENRLSQAIQQTTNSAHGQSQILSDLKSMAFQYLSLYGMQNFVTNMVQITGELQLQAKSLEVILNNASAAKQMYGEIRDLSQMSPYSFEDLLKSHRQLAAFGIEPKDMFPTMKSLADIGAGLDVDISRLILAFGHTRSYGYLSGIQNRQFENAGIDMIGGLAAKYNELADAEKRAGREAEYVSRADIFKKMRARSIPFEDVQDVVLDLDRPGGKFYNMQIRQFETLGGKLRNLRNNYRIMMSEIGNSNQGFLMGSVNVINELTEHWEKYARVIKGVALAYAGLKLAGLASNRAVAAANQEIAAMTVANNRAAGITSYMNGSTSMWRAMGSSRRLNFFKHGFASSKNDDAVLNLAANTQINNITKQRVALTGKLTQAQRELLLVESGIAKERATQIAGYSAWKRGLMSVRLGMIGVAQSAKAMAVALLSDPMTWIMAAIAGITALADKLGETSEQAENLKKTMMDAAQTDIDGLKQLLEPYEKNGVLTIKGAESTSREGYTATRKFVNVDEAELEAHGIEGVFDELNRALQVQSPFYDGDYFDIMKAKDQTEQVQEMFRKLENFNYVKQVEQMTAGRIEMGFEETGAEGNPLTWLRGESLGTNMKDYADAQAELFNKIRISETTWNSFEEQDKKAIENYVKELGISRDEAVIKYISNTDDIASARMRSAIGKDNSKLLDKANMRLYDASVDMKPVATSFASVFKDNFKGNMDGAMTYFEDVMNKLYAEQGIGSPEAQEALSTNMAITIRAAMERAGDKAAGEEFLSKYIERQVGVIANKLTSREVTVNTKEGDIKKISEKNTKAAIEAIKKENPKLAREMSKLGTSTMKALIENVNKSGAGLANSLRKILSWQERAKRFGIKVSPSIDVDYTEFINEQRKMIKESEDKLKANSKRIKTILKVDVLPDFNFKNAAEVKAFLKLITNQKKHHAKDIENFIRTHRDKDGITRGENAVKLSNMRGELDSLKDYEEFAKVILGKGSFLDSEHQSWTDDSKKKSKNGNRKDVYAESLRREMRALSDAYNVYREWEKKIGSGGALAKVREQFFGKDSLLKKQGYTFDDIPNYLKTLDKLNAKVIRHYGTKKANKHIVAALQEEIKKAINQVKVHNFDDATEKWASKVSLYLDRLTKKWEQYNKVLTATGDKQLAMSLSGFNIEKYQNAADALKDRISFNLKMFGAKTPYHFNTEESDESIEKSVQNMLGRDFDADKIKGIVEALKKWRDLQNQINDESIETYANLIGGITRYMDAVRKAESTYNETMRQIGKAFANGDITQTQYDNAKNLAAGKKEREILEMSPDYKLLKSANTSQSIQSVIPFANSAKTMLKRQFENGAISAEEYADKIKDITTALNTLKDKSTTSILSTFLSRGLVGVSERKRDEAYDVFVKSSKESESATYTQQQARAEMEREPGNIDKRIKYESASLSAHLAASRTDKAKLRYKEKDDELESTKKFTKAMDDAVNGMTKLNGAIGLLGGVFSSLGMEGGANAASDASNMLGGALQGASSLSFLGPWGMAAGAGLGLLSGIAQSHDNRLERQIGMLKEDVSKIEGYTRTISKAQERTLGYDRGDLIRSYQRQYANNTYMSEKKWFNSKTGKIETSYALKNKDGAAGDAMADYYNSAGGAGVNGYQQQLNMLERKRKDYIDIYNAEDSKKKKSKAAMQEAKEKIAELDDQIRFFSEDLAKSLWDIDIKGWANQLSDALANAFENGESMAEAYRDTVTNILQQMGQKMMQLEIMQPMFKSLQTKLFGDKESGEKGVFDPKDMNGSARKVTAVVADFFGKDGEGKKTLVAAQEFMTSYEKALNDAGLSSKPWNNSPLSSGIQGTSEETSALLAGYINALRQDVSVIRIIQTQFINEAWPDYIKQITGMASTLVRIDANVAAIRSIISENGELYERVNDLASDLRSVIYGNQKLHIA